ncbi:MAG TPA: putative hydro-lyase [Nocardioidaceae bacterium]|nr:putative hydro-lyase [Nocardioidaceae bacterium]
MSEAAELTPAQLRARIRSGSWDRGTTGACLGFVQANLVVLQAELAEDFRTLCRANPRPLPLLEATAAGVPDRLHTAPGADLTTDLPRYHIHRNGVVTEEVSDLAGVWRDDLVAFLLGCSFSAERRLQDAGVRLRHLETGRGVPMFVTALECEGPGSLHGPMVVSMRPIAEGEVDRARQVTGRLPLAHGAPVHVGDPSAIGITDLDAPDWGDPIDIAPGEVPVFWACGVTPQTIIRTAKPAFAVTHAPGHMFVSDVPDSAIEGRTDITGWATATGARR